MGAELPVLPEGWPHTSQQNRTCQVTPRINWLSRRDQFEKMWRENVDVEEMADFFETSKHMIYAKASQWRLGRRRERGSHLKGLARSRKAAKSGGRRLFRSDPTGQRRKVRLAASTGPHVNLEPHDPRLVAGITIFPTSVVPVGKLPRLLKSGHNSFKIGKIVTKGRWKDMPIFTLTLQERATCPRTCLQWATCYGNNMPFAHRIHDDGTLTRRLWGELAALNAQYPAGFVVRLHVLGDFFSVEYVEFWRQALADFPALRVFGFTARKPADPIGAALVRLVAEKWDRFCLRFSGAGYETHSAEVVDRPEEATGIRCPAETDETRSCATCGLCWQTDRTISFVKH